MIQYWPHEQLPCGVRPAAAADGTAAAAAAAAVAAAAARSLEIESYNVAAIAAIRSAAQQMWGLLLCDSRLRRGIACCTSLATSSAVLAAATAAGSGAFGNSR